MLFLIFNIICIIVSLKFWSTYTKFLDPPIEVHSLIREWIARLSTCYFFNK